MRSYDNDFLIDGNPILSTDEGVTIGLEDLDSDESGRDESGVMHRIILREKVMTWGLAYSTLTLEEWAYMDSLFRGKSTFTVSTLDLEGSPVSYTAYCSKMGLKLYNKRTGLFKGLSFNIIEC